MQVLLAGDPNCGKSTLFARLTGKLGNIANYPGSTVEQRVGTLILPQAPSCTLVDLPGCYSLTKGISLDQDIAVDAVINSAANDVVVAVVDAMQLARSLFFVLQLKARLPAKHPSKLVVALNMMDEVEHQGIRLNIAKLAEYLAMPVIGISARTRLNIPCLVASIAQAAAARAVERDTFAGTNSLDYRHAGAIGGVGEHESVGGRVSPDGVGQTRVVDQAADPVQLHQQARQLAASVTTAPAVQQPAARDPDQWLLQPIIGTGLGLLCLFSLFQLVFTLAEPFINAIDHTTEQLQQVIDSLVPTGLTQSLLSYGVLLGVMNTLKFLPQITLLFLGLVSLEESGLLARLAFLFDGLMRKVGLSGRACVPLLSSFACAVPGIMAARSLPDHQQRLKVSFVAPFMSCSARLPVYSLVLATAFAHRPKVLGVFSFGGVMVFAMYCLGIAVALGTLALLNRPQLTLASPPMVLAMPRLRWPSWPMLWRLVWQRVWAFVSQTGPIIVTISIILWALLSFPQAAVSAPGGIANSYAGHLGRALEPLLAPLGFDWRLGIGILASFAAREVLVSTLAQVYALDNLTSSDASEAVQQLAGVMPLTPLQGLSLLVFFVLALQCMSTFAVVKRETNSWRWPIFQLAFMNTLAYLASLITFQLGRVLGYA